MSVSSLRSSTVPILVLMLAAYAGTAAAGDITVNTTADDNAVNSTCSLREAMQAQFQGSAYQGCTGATAAGPNVIKFSANGTYTVPVNLPHVVAARNLQVTGATKTVTIACSANRLFDADPNSNLSIDNLTLSGCTTGGSGLAINSNGANLSLLNVTVKNFISNSGANGAAIAHSGGNLSMTNVVMSGNKVDDNNANTFVGSGGALYITNVELPKTVNIVTTTFDSNRADKNGGAVYIVNNPSLGHSITFTGAVFNNNQAFGNNTQDGGGAIWIQSGNDVTDLILMTDTLFSGNKAVNGAGGAILLALNSQLAYINANAPSAGGIFASHFLNNVAAGPAGNDGSGGAIFSRGNLTVVQSSFQGNKSNNGSGGAIAFGNSGSTSVLANVTFNANAAVQNGGAIARLSNSDAVKLINDTLAGNGAGGTGGQVGGGEIYNTSAASGITARNTIVGNSTTTGGVTNVGGNCQGYVQNLGNNLQFSPNTGCGSPAIAAGNPLLEPMAPSVGINVGVFTMRLDTNYSVALNAGDEPTCAAGPMLRFDATGTPLARPNNGPNCDIGAYESGKIPDVIFRDDLE